MMLIVVRVRVRVRIRVKIADKQFLKRKVLDHLIDMSNESNPAFMLLLLVICI